MAARRYRVPEVAGAFKDGATIGAARALHRRDSERINYDRETQGLRRTPATGVSQSRVSGFPGRPLTAYRERVSVSPVPLPPRAYSRYRGVLRFGSADGDGANGPLLQ